MLLKYRFKHIYFTESPFCNIKAREESRLSIHMTRDSVCIFDNLLIVCCPVVNECNFEMYNMNSQYVEAIGKARNNGLDSVTQRMLMTYTFDRLQHNVKS